jgi:hypothetical protein
MDKYKLMCKSSAGYKETNDCSVKALAIAGRVSYAKAHAVTKSLGRKHRKGMPMWRIIEAMKMIGCSVEHIKKPKKKDGSGYTMMTIGKGFPRGYYIVEVRGHVAAMINGDIMDWSDGRKHRVTDIYKLTVPRGSRS